LPFRTPFATFCKQLLTPLSIRFKNEAKDTNMRVEDLYLTQHGVEYDGTRSCFADEPVPSKDIRRLTIERVRVYACLDYGKSREDG